MGNGYIYYDPESDGGRETVDLGAPFGELADQSEPLGKKTRALGGQVFPSSLGRYDRVRVSRGGIESQDTAMALRSFEAYAEAYHPFALSLDHAKTFAGYCTQQRLRGATTIRMESGNAFAALSASGTVASGDYVVIESGYPEFKWEVAKVSSYSSNTLTLSAGLKRSYRETPILVRWYRFWPFLCAESTGPMVTTASGVIWDFAVEATTIAAANRGGFLLSQFLDSGTGGAGSKPGGKSTYNEFIGGQTRDDGLGKRGGKNSQSGIGGFRR